MISEKLRYGPDSQDDLEVDHELGPEYAVYFFFHLCVAKFQLQNERN